jgi:hypothetical protein
MEVKPSDEVLEALMKKQQCHCHNAEIHSTGNVHISHAFTTRYVYVIYCNIMSVIMYRNVYFTLLISPLSLASLQISVREIGSQGIFQ